VDVVLALVDQAELVERDAALHEALDLCGRDHYLTTQVLDTLGLSTSARTTSRAAEFFERAIQAKQRFGDDPRPSPAACASSAGCTSTEPPGEAESSSTSRCACR